ncbi:MAG: DUF2812 domain-containing protein [Oscillospiraceae bacterium]|nr:DUF2812 domain-containing protein [Oscillospiraceae bacterium]
MIRWKFTFDKDEEQDWLNDYAQEGWAMVSFFVGLVTFVPCQPGEFIYQIDLLPGKGLWADNYEDYVIFMNEMNVEILQRWGRWVYLRKRAEDGPFEVYTDTASKIELYRRIRTMFTWAAIVVSLCSASAWSMLFQYPESMFSRGLAGLYFVMIVTMLRAVWHCSWKIKELERQDR